MKTGLLNKRLPILVLAVCVLVLAVFLKMEPAAAPEGISADKTAVAAAQTGEEQGDELVFSPLSAASMGVAGLDPTSTLVLERLASEADARSATVTTAPAEAATAAFVSTTGGSYSSQVRSWQSINSDVKGWLRVPGTNINYPVLYHPDINYYLYKDVYKNYSKMGCVWTNGSTVFGNSSQISKNTVLYGHNWTNYSASPRIASSSDQMFAQLTGYHYLSVAQQHPYIYYSTADEDMTFKIFACFYTELAFNYINSSGGQYIIDEAIRRSRHNFDVDVNSSDKILTLSTCTRAYGNTSNQRFVVMARLLRPGESSSQSYSITANSGHKQPSVW